eukprot:6891565-Pyramimonas_sp.AAC.1
MQKVEELRGEAGALVLRCDVDYICIDAKARVGEQSTDWFGGEGAHGGNIAQDSVSRYLLLARPCIPLRVLRTLYD